MTRLNMHNIAFQIHKNIKMSTLDKIEVYESNCFKSSQHQV